jgi:hypothetical protein
MKSADTRSGRPTLDEMGQPIVALLLVIMLASVFLLWTLNSLTEEGQDMFAIFLAVDFVAFAMMSYIYRTLLGDGGVSKVLIIAGCVFIVALFVLSFTL